MTFLSNTKQALAAEKEEIKGWISDPDIIKRIEAQEIKKAKNHTIYNITGFIIALIILSYITYLRWPIF